MPAPDPRAILSAQVPKLLVPSSSCIHTASNSPAPALQTPHYTLNHTCPVPPYPPVVLMHLNTLASNISRPLSFHCLSPHLQYTLLLSGFNRLPQDH